MIAVVDYRKGNLKSVERGLFPAGGDARITDDTDVIARADAIVLPGVGAFADAAASMAELGQMGVIRDRIDAGVPFLGICLGMHLMFEEGVEGAPEEDDEESSHNAKGLAVLPGVVTRMPKVDAEGRAYKIPHVGWNSVVLPTCRSAEPADAARLPGTESRRSKPSSRTEYASSGFHGDLRRQGASRCLTAPTCVSFGDFACPIFADTKAGEHFYFTHSYIAPDTPATVAVTTHSVTFPCAVQFRDNAFGVQFHPEKSSDAGATVLRAFVQFVNER